MKYRLIDKTTGIETLCDKVTIDGFDYYVSDESIKQGSYWFDGTNIRKDYSLHLISGFDRKVIATNNPNIDIPKVVDEVEEITKDERYSNSFRIGFKHGYNKSQETHSFSEDDMKSFLKFSIEYRRYNDLEGLSKTSEELLQIWKEQKPKTVYYNG